MKPAEQECFRSTEFPEWKPGRRVIVVVPPPQQGEWILIMVIYGVLFGLMAGYALHVGFGDFAAGGSMSFVEAFIICAIPFSIVGAMHLAGGDMTSGKLDMNWEENTLSVFSKFSTKRFALDDMTALRLRAEYQTKAGSVRGSRIGAVYNARLEALIGEEAILLLATESRVLDEDRAVEELARFGQELAETTQVELKREEAIEQRPRGFLSAILAAPIWMHASFVGVVSLATFWVAWRAQLLN